MAYYNRNNKKLHINENAFKYLNCGECAKIKHNDNMILKEYFSNTMLNCRLTPQLFDILKTINNPHFIELYDLYTDYSFIELLKSKLSLQTFYPDAYTAKYYKENTTDPLCEPIDYLLDNFNELEHLFEIFTTNEIITSDVKRKNAILSPDKIIIIDPDTFYLTTYNKEKISIANKERLLNLFRSISVYSLSDYDNYGKNIIKLYEDLTNIEITENTSVTNEISKKLQYVKRPIDYFTK